MDREPRRDYSECSDQGIDNAIWTAFDGYVRRYDLDGYVIWTRQFGSGLYDIVSGLGSDGDSVYAAGMTRCVIEDDVEAENGSLVDGFVVKLAIDPSSHSGRVQLIVGQVETLSDAGRITSGAFDTLVSHLESAIAALDSSQPAVAKRALRAFIGLVDNYAANGRLTASEADALIVAATAIDAEL